MIEILGITVTYEAILIGILIYEELVPYLPFKGNNVVESLNTLAQFIKIFARKNPEGRKALERAKDITDTK